MIMATFEQFYFFKKKKQKDDAHPDKKEDGYNSLSICIHYKKVK